MDTITTRVATAVPAAAISTAYQTSAENLTVVNQSGAPGDAQKVAVFDPLTAETGIEIVIDTYNQELAKIRSQAEIGNLIWDVASVRSLNDAVGCDEGLLERSRRATRN